MISVTIVSAALAFALTWASMPLFRRYALVRPNARSGHKLPTPQGGGAIIILVVLGSLIAALPIFGLSGQTGLAMAGLLASMIGLALLGAVADFERLSAIPRLTLQAVLIGGGVYAAWRLANLGPLEGLDIAVFITAAIAGLWFVNLTNFMDGLDWLTVANLLPTACFAAVFGWLGYLSFETACLAAAVAGGLLGFAPFNAPRARLFMGDVGSLPLGFATAWLLFQLAASGWFAAAILLQAYPCVDATWTLLRRIKRPADLARAHREHFYQRAADAGVSPMRISISAFGVNLALAALAAVSILWPVALVSWLTVLAGAGLVAMFLRQLSAGKTS